MAFRGAASNFVSGATSVTVNVGSLGIQSGDILLMFIATDASSITSWPSGFSAITGANTMSITNAEGTTHVFVQSKIANGAEGNLTISWSGSHFSTALVRAYSGRSGAPFAVAPVITGPAAGGVMPVTTTITGITANAGDDLVLWVPGPQLAAGTDTPTFTPPSGWTNNRTDTGTATFDFWMGSCDKLNWGGGATGTLTGTLDVTPILDRISTGYGGYLFSLAQNYTLVQSANGSSFNTGVPSVSATLPKAVTSGNTLIAYVGCVDLGNTSNTYTVSDNVNSGNYVADITNGGSGNFALGIFRFSAAAAGTPTITATRSGGASTSHMGIVVEEWSGISPTNPADQPISNFNGVINQSPTSGNTGNFFEGGELFLSAGVVANSLTWSAGTGFTMSPQTAGGLGGFLAAENQVLSTTTGTAATFSITSTQFWQVVAVAYKPAQPNLGPQTSGVQIGTIGATVGAPITAQSGSFAVGTITPTVAPNLGAITGTFFEGSLLNQLNLGAQTATFAEGILTVTITGNVTLGISGQAMSISGGQFADNVGYILDNTIQGINIVGQTATFAQGTMGFIVSPQLTPQTLTSTFNAPTFTPTYTLSALTITSTEGQLAVALGSNVTANLAGQTISSLEGAMQVAPTYTMASNTDAFSVGVITFSATGDQTINLFGQSALFTEGLIVQVAPPDEWLARSLLVNAGLIPIVQYNEDPSVPSGRVISQSPAAGQSVPVNTPVTMVVSRGPLSPAGQAIVPNVIGLAWQAATTALFQAFVSQDKFLWQVNSAQQGTVVAQSVAAGTLVQPGAIVQLTLSAGPSKVPSTATVPLIH